MSPLVRAICVSLLLITPSAIQGQDTEGPSESECRPYIEKALQGVHPHQIEDTGPLLNDEGDQGSSVEQQEELSDEKSNERTILSEEEDLPERRDGSEVIEESLEEKVEEAQESLEEKDDKSEDDKTDQESVEDAQDESGEQSTKQEPSSTEETNEQQSEEETTDVEGSQEESEPKGKLDELFDQSSVPSEERSVEDEEVTSKIESPEEEASTETPEENQTSKENDLNEESQENEETQSTETEGDVLSKSVEEVQQSEEEAEKETSEEQQLDEAASEDQISEESETPLEEQDVPEESENNENQQSVEDTITEEASPSEEEALSQDEQQSEEGTEKDNASEEGQHSVEESVQDNEDGEQSVEVTASQETQSDEDATKTQSEEETVNDEPSQEEKSEEVISKEAEISTEEEQLEKSSESELPKEEEEDESKTELPEEVGTSQEEQDQSVESEKLKVEDVESEETEKESKEENTEDAVESENADSGQTKETEAVESEKEFDETKQSEEELTDEKEEESKEEEKSDVEDPEEEELIMVPEVPEKLRSRGHMGQILHLDAETEETEQVLSKTVEHTLKELKKLYEAAIKPLEILYKYRDLSNRHFGDPEIFSKPLILFMGPWSGGKSTIINYLLENEYKTTSLRTGADPSPAYFNIVMWGDEPEIVDGTQLAADWTFSGLQKFGQGLLDRLRGLKLNHPLLQKVNIVEIPGILEIRKQVERLFPFNDACQWFIDRADIIFLVYDPSKLDIGPETEAILDQLKGREMQTRIILNKADQVKPEELMRVQGTLIWNISPLMSSTEPPVMYSTSLWSLPYEAGSPTRLLHAQERAFLADLRSAIDKRVENKIAGARRFAVRVRNHAKMVDCYLTTYYNHKSFFDNKKKVSDDIIEHPQNYHIYEGLSTLTNISRYDLPDPDVYRDFFRLNPVYEFQQLSATCTYFRGCPINRLDLAIAYDLPELIGKYKKSVEELLKSYNARK